MFYSNMVSIFIFLLFSYYEYHDAIDFDKFFVSFYSLMKWVLCGCSFAWCQDLYFPFILKCIAVFYSNMVSIFIFFWFLLMNIMMLICRLFLNLLFLLSFSWTDFHFPLHNVWIFESVTVHHLFKLCCIALYQYGYHIYLVPIFCNHCAYDLLESQCSIKIGFLMHGFNCLNVCIYIF